MKKVIATIVIAMLSMVAIHTQEVGVTTSVWMEKTIMNPDGSGAFGTCSIVVEPVSFNMETKVAKVPVSVWFSKAHYDAGNPPVFKFDIFIDRESLGSVTVPEATPLYDVIFTQVLTLAITQSWSPLKDAVVHPLN